MCKSLLYYSTSPVFHFEKCTLLMHSLGRQDSSSKVIVAISTTRWISLISSVKKNEVTTVIYKNLGKKTVLIMRSLAQWYSFLINLRPQGKFHKTGTVLMLCPSYSKKAKWDEGRIYQPIAFYQTQIKQWRIHKSLH